MTKKQKQELLDLEKKFDVAFSRMTRLKSELEKTRIALKQLEYEESSVAKLVYLTKCDWINKKIEYGYYDPNKTI